MTLPSPVSRALAIAMICAAALCLSAVLPATKGFAQQIPDFYSTTPQDMSGKPGSIIRQEAIVEAVPEGAQAWRVLYRSTGLDGEPVPVSAVVVAPGGVPPATGRPIVAWQHPTSGVDRLCAPSLSPNVLQMIMGLGDLLAQGYAVVATDYPGLGTEGHHAYLVGESEGRAVLDAVRAVRNLPDVVAGDRFALWGHSQGGHATLFAGLLAPHYAPELTLVGVAAAAPAAQLDKLIGSGAGTPDAQLFTALLMASWTDVYGLQFDGLIAPADRPAVEALTRVCFYPPIDSDTQPPDAPMPDASYSLLAPLASTQPWSTLLRLNSAGVLPATVPVFLAQGSADTTIPPQATESYMASLCAAGVPVRMLERPGVAHRFIARDVADDAAHWIADRFSGLPAPDDCINILDGFVDHPRADYIVRVEIGVPLGAVGRILPLLWSAHHCAMQEATQSPKVVEFTTRQAIGNAIPASIEAGIEVFKNGRGMVAEMFLHRDYASELQYAVCATGAKCETV